MTSKFKREVNLESLLIYDIETASRNENLIEGSAEHESFKWFKRDKETCETLDFEELNKIYKREAALHPAYNRIVAITISFIKGNTLYYKSFKGEQKDILRGFLDVVEGGNYELAGANINSFDTPTLRMKIFEEGFENSLPDKLSDAFKKPWEVSGFDVMTSFKGSYYHNLSLDQMCLLAGIESPKSDINGSQITKAFYDGEINRIVKYCEKDVISTALFICAFSGQPNLLENFVNKTEVIVEKIPVLHKLKNTDTFSDDIKQEIRQSCKGKRLTKQDKENLKVIILGVWERNNFITKEQDNKKTKELKEIEVQDFINNL